MKMKIVIFGLIVVSLFLIAGCTKRVPTDQNMPGPNNTQIANPASKFCTDNGGILEIRNDANDGQVGYCKIAGKECEEWSLMRGECSQIHICTAEEKSAEICTMEYMPVCGNDNVTYGNKCSACAAKIDLWTVGECGN